MDSNDLVKKLTLDWTKAQPSVDRFIRSFVHRRADADDVLQEVALAVVDGYESYDPARPFLGWALGIARHVVIGHLRNKYRDRHVYDAHAIERVAVAFERIDPPFNDMKDALGQCIATVSGRNRSVLQLRYTQGLDHRHIAERMKMTANNVGVLLHRVRKSLRECVERRLGNPDAGLAGASGISGGGGGVI